MAGNTKQNTTERGRPPADLRFVDARTLQGGEKPNKSEPRDDTNTTTTPPKPPRTPKALSGNKVARKKWRDLSKELIQSRTLGSTDFDALEAYCLYYAEFTQAREERKGELVLKTESGNMIQHPLLSIERTAYDKCQRLREQLGMTPVTRSKITKTTTPGQDDLLT